MKTRLSITLALAIGLAVVLGWAVAVQGAGIPARPQSAAPVAPAAPAGGPSWTQSNTSGFGDAQNEIVLALAPFKGKLWASTYNVLSGQGFQLWWFDGSGWTAEWAGDPGYANTVGIDHLIVFSDALYAGTWNEVDGGEVWRTADGSNWEGVSDPGFGDPTNGEVFRFEVYSDTLYAGTVSYTDTHGAEIWRSATGDASDWARVVEDGFGDAGNFMVVSLGVFSDTLYAGTRNHTDGCEVWRSTTGSAGTWSQVNTNGFGDANNRAVSALAVFGNYLYASTVGNTGFGSQVWRCQACDGSDWAKVVDDGFGNSETRALNALEVYDGYLFFVAGNTPAGLQVWLTADGTTWEQIGFAGFDNINNAYPYWDNSVAVYGNELYVGTANWTDGGEVWSFANFGWTLDPIAPPDSTFSYTLEDIYDRLDTGAASSPITFTEHISGPTVGTGRTLDEVMAIAPAVDDTNGATQTHVLKGHTAWGLTSGEWGLITGTYELAPVPKTGAGDLSGYTEVVGEDGHANMRRGVPWPSPRFSNNGDGTVTDNLTGLIWLRNANCTVFSFGDSTGQNNRVWTSAIAASRNLAAGYCGLTDGSVAGDWRLPNVKELQSLIDFSQFPIALPSGYPFTGVMTGSDYYWSSTTLCYNYSIAWHINFINGLTQGYDKTTTWGVWPVRGGQ